MSLLADFAELLYFHILFHRRHLQKQEWKTLTVVEVE